MPKGGRYVEKKKIREIITDVKLSDFANNTAAAGRVRKSSTNFLNQKVKDVYETEKLWFHEEVEDFEVPYAETSVGTQKKKATKLKHSDLFVHSDVVCNRYPIDLWFLISEYIKPEDVTTFTLLCKDSYFVSRTYIFWINMYKRYYNPAVPVPNRLQPSCIEGSLHLKMSVIRSLYHMYPHFTKRLNASPNAAYSLTNLHCTLIWHMQKNKNWLFFFKFQMPIDCDNSKITFSLRKSDSNKLKKSYTDNLKDVHDNVNANPNEGSRILRIVSSNFVAVTPSIMGSRLTDIRINLAHDMQHQKVQLTFCFSTYKQFCKNVSGNKGFGGYGEIIEFDPVESITVLNWWHPQYPEGYQF